MSKICRIKLLICTISVIVFYCPKLSSLNVPQCLAACFKTSNLHTYRGGEMLINVIKY